MQLTVQEEQLLMMYVRTTEETRNMAFYERCMSLFYEQAHVVDIGDKRSLKQTG